MRLALFVGIAATALSVALAEPLVIAAFQHGQFQSRDSAETTLALRAQGLGIFLVAGVRQLVVVFFALGRTMAPVYVAIVDLVVFYLVASTLSQSLGHVGVSVAVTVARVTQFVLLWRGLSAALPQMHGTEIWRSFFKSATCALIAAVSAKGLLGLLPGDALAGGWPATFTLASSALTFALVFFGSARLLRHEELSRIIEVIVRKRRSD